MRDTEDDFLRVVDNLYGTASGEVGWSQALASVTDLFGGVGAVVFDLDLATNQITSWTGRGLESGERDYIDHINAINPRMRFSLGRPPGHIAYESLFISRREMERHEFYDWLRRIENMSYFVGSKLQEVDGMATFTSVEFTDTHGHATDEEINRYRLLTRHIRNAWNLYSRIDCHRAAHDRLNFISDTIPWGVLVVAADGRVVEANTTAVDMLAAGDGLSCRGAVLTAAKAAENRTLQSAVARAVGTPVTRSPGPEAMIVSRPSGLPAYQLQFVPFIRPAVLGSNPPVVIIYVTDPASRAAATASQLRQMFGLSVQEARLAHLLMQGAGIAAAAGSLGISPNTARNHLRSIFRKTETHGQVELIRLLSRLVPSPDGDPNP